MLATGQNPISQLAGKLGKGTLYDYLYGDLYADLYADYGSIETTAATRAFSSDSPLLLKAGPVIRD